MTPTRTIIAFLFVCQCLASSIAQNTQNAAEDLLDIADDWERQNYDSSYYYSTKALDVSRELGAKVSEIKSLNNVGYSLHKMSKYPESYASHKAALALAEELRDTSQIAKTYNFLGVYYDALSDTDEALQNFLKSYELRVHLKDTLGMAIVAANIGLDYENLGQYELAEKYLIMTYQIDSILNDTLYFMGDLINLGLLYKHTDRLQKSEQVTLQALDLAQKTNSTKDVALILGNLGMIYLQDKKYRKSEEFLLRSLQMREEIGKTRDLVITNTNLARLYEGWGKYQKSLSYAEAAHVLNKKGKSRKQEERILSTKISSNESLGNFKVANKYSKALLQLKDSVSTEIRLQKLASVEAQLNILEKENELIQQKISIENLKIKNRIKTLWLIFGSLGLLGVFFIVYLFRSRAFSKKSAQLQKKYTQDLIKSTEDSLKRISSELHDSIGQSLLLIKNKILLNPEDAQKDIRIVDEAIDEVRTISQALHPFQFEKLGLIKSLAYMIDQFQANSNTFYSHDIDVESAELPDNTSIYIYRIIQECVNNVEKHASAKACNLTVERRSNHYLFQLKDNGKGFDLSENTELLNSLGMKTLRERAQIIGAQLVIDSTKGKGTTIRIKVPIGV